MSLYETLKKDAPEMVAYENERRISFSADNYSIWRNAFDLLEMQLKISCEIIGEYISEVRPLIDDDEKFLFDAVSALHGNGCFVAQEIFVLMRAGYAAGALARWRKLYEIGITALYLEQNGRGSGNDLARRYLDHSIIEKYKSVKIYSDRPKVYDEHSKKLGYEPYPKKDIQTLKRKYCELSNKYGPDYCKDYGWASSKEKKQVNLNDLARAVRLGFLRPYYQLANGAVHSGPGSLFWNISLPIHSRDTILIGPTYYGMAEPGQLLTLFLNHINFALLSLHPSLIAREILIINNWLTDEIMDALMKVHNAVDSRDVTVD